MDMNEPTKATHRINFAIICLSKLFKSYSLLHKLFISFEISPVYYKGTILYSKSAFKKLRNPGD